MRLRYRGPRGVYPTEDGGANPETLSDTGDLTRGRRSRAGEGVKDVRVWVGPVRKKEGTVYSFPSLGETGEGRRSPLWDRPERVEDPRGPKSQTPWL